MAIIRGGARMRPRGGGSKRKRGRAAVGLAGEREEAERG